MSYFIGLRPPQETSDVIAHVQQQVRRRYPQQLIQPLVPHVTVIPPPFIQGLAAADRSELERRIGRQAGRFFPLNLVLGEIGEIEAFPGHPAMVMGIDSPPALELRAELFGLLPNRPNPTTELHLTLAQPPDGMSLPHDLALEYQAELGHLVGASIAIDGLTAFVATGARQYAATPITMSQQN